ncbi:hypothetical protein BN1221_02343 [Brenneria goodwinii]|uniref:Uncharacterized protein n=1 Tax=Brenneria goodwinii TaxID=1109412 RepID=A0A0G4JVZ1_9GAMM|nr:hypothetical protein BN1221_02343 [Brenneria goodwinii]
MIKPLITDKTPAECLTSWPKRVGDRRADNKNTDGIGNAVSKRRESRVNLTRCTRYNPPISII